MNKIDDHIIYDPHSTILATADYIEGLGGTFDPATSLGLALEAIGFTTSTTLQEMVLNDKNIHPALATDTKHLLKHVTDDEERDLFATPSEAYITIYVNINDTIHNALKETVEVSKTTTYSFTIGKNSTITVADTVFTIMDDINITLLVDKDGNKSMSVLYDADDDSYVYGGIGVLPSNIIVNDGIEWGVFQLPVKQLDVSLTSTTTIADSITDVTIAIEDQYVYSEVFMTYGDVRTKLSKVFSKETIDITKPTVHISVEDDQVVYSIPKPYIFNGLIKGELSIFTYTTQGKIELPLSEFETKDFSFKLFLVNKDLNYTVTSNINILATSDYIVDGGVNRRPFKDVRNKIINKTAGNIASPVTEEQLIERVKNKGFTIFKLLDTVTDRTFVAVRNTSRNSISPLPTNIDVFLPTVSLSNNDIVVNDNENIYVQEGTLFKVVNGVCVPFQLPLDTKFNTVKLLNENEIFVSPFYYTISRSKGVIDSKVYDLRTAFIEKITVLKRNTLLLVTCNITSYRIIKHAGGYDLYIELSGNDKFSSIEDDVGIQIGFNTKEGALIYYETTVYTVQENDILLAEFAGKKLHKVTVSTDFLINDGIKLYNDLDTTNSLTKIPLECVANVSIFTTSPVATQHLDSADNATDFQVDKLFNSANRVTITTEKLIISFGKEITGLWSSAYALYNNNRYLRYIMDQYETYDEDVYEQFDNCNYKIEDTDGDGICDTISKNILHTKGEFVLVDGEKVIKHHKGEIIYVNGKPVEDKKGLDIFADIVLLDYRYDYLNISVYTDYRNYILDQLVKWCLIDLKEVNDNMLERSVLLFKPNKNLSPVITKGGDFDGLIKPTIELYYDDSIELDTDFSTLTDAIGKIVATYFGKRYIDINDLEKSIKEVLPENPASVKVTYNASEANIINIISDNRFRLGKKITPTGELVYDLDLIIKRI